MVDTYQPGDTLDNWLQPRWEYMHFHPLIKQLDLSKIGVVEERGKILGVIHFEHAEWQVYFQLRPGYNHIKTNLFDYQYLRQLWWKSLYINRVNTAQRDNLAENLLN